VCGDLRGNLILFPLLKGLLLNTSVASDVKVSPLNYFKGVHGISSVSSVSFGRLSSNLTEICSVWPDFKLLCKKKLLCACLRILFIFFYFLSCSDRWGWVHLLCGI
jgi:hypothetical protein